MKRPLDRWDHCGYTVPMSKIVKVEMKLRLDPGLKSRLEAEARTATGKLGRTISLNEYAVAILLGVVLGQIPPALHRPAVKRRTKEK